MSSSLSKNNILKKIRLALTHSTPIPFPKSEGTDYVFQPLEQDIVVEFAEQFTQLGGKFAFCMDESELNEQFGELYRKNEWNKIFCIDNRFLSTFDQARLTDDLVNCDIAITGCEALVARTGSIVLSSKTSGRVTSVYTPIHICIAYASQLVYDLKDALPKLFQKYNGELPSLVTLATGPSRTADIEKTLVVGVHGPKEVYLFLVDDLVEPS
jgi:L-lactate dehydrogenase complex protein LldG